MPNILVIIPTYNEQENIIKLIDKLNSLKSDLDILVVDDGDDNTEELIRGKQADTPNLFLIKRNGKSGRGSAVLDGLKFGLQKDYQYLAEMDADFSHQPEELPGLLKMAKLDNIIIGSRYARGSRIVNWPIKRRIFSKLANFYANAILRIGIFDYTNGYRIYGRKAIEKLDFNLIKSKGYIVLSEISYQMHKKGVKFIECKSLFINRNRGASNFSLKEIKEAFISVIKIKREVDKKIIYGD